MNGVLIQTNEFPPISGGVGSYCLGFASALVRRGVRVRVVAARKTKMDDAYDATLPFPVHRAYQRIPVIRHFFRAIQMIKCLSLDRDAVLWAAEWRSGMVTALLSFLFRRKMMITIHGTEFLDQNDSFFLRLFAMPVYRRAWRIIAISDYTHKIIVEGLPQYADKTVVIKNGINAEQFSDVPRERVEALIARYQLQRKRIILSLCRLVPRKGVDQAIIAFSKLRTSVPDAVLVIAGTGPEEVRLKELVARLDLGESVVFTGYVPDEEIALWYHASSLYIMLSRKDGAYVEGFGLTFLEANACGKPVVGGDHGGVPEAVIDGETGYIVDPLDPIAAAKAMEKILLDKDLYERMSLAGLALVHGEASWDRAAGEIIELLKDPVR
ncbi:glycosyltransferase family 1 protein [Verrucomicrobia bacterium S94]|nr:glycosyltransferase family 1 protein [Verrucomicrobia bacterium S94]